MLRTALWSASMLIVLACSGSPEDGDTAAAQLPEPAPLAELSGTCPTLTTGALTLTSGGVERDVRVFLPPGTTEGAPLLYIWHPLGMSASQIAQYADAQGLASRLGAVVVVPDALEDSLFDWEFIGNETHDITLFDDLRTCASDQLGIDLRRVYTTGMSAGGLWTSYLTMHRADTLAASLIMSGGTEPVVEYESPEADIPTLLFFGGSSDTWSGGGISVDFEEATLAMAEELSEDVSTVVLCEHALGHQLPPSGMDTVTTWLMPHSFGAASPFADGDLSSLPSGCALVD